MERLIGLCGFAGAGKDATAALLGMVGFRRVAFADGVREELRGWLAPNRKPLAGMPPELWLAAFGVSKSEIDFKPTTPAMRTVIQLWGTEFRRAQDPQYWVKYAMQKVAQARMSVGGTFDCPVVVTDVRFPNEVEAVRERGGVIWKINRPGLTADGHVSERNVEDVIADVELVNDGTLLELAEKVKLCLEG